VAGFLVEWIGRQAVSFYLHKVTTVLDNIVELSQLPLNLSRALWIVKILSSLYTYLSPNRKPPFPPRHKLSLPTELPKHDI
jgi:hypothetical protein